jgi:hypothetical protein
MGGSWYGREMKFTWWWQGCRAEQLTSGLTGSGQRTISRTFSSPWGSPVPMSSHFILSPASGIHKSTFYPLDSTLLHIPQTCGCAIHPLVSQVWLEGWDGHFQPCPLPVLRQGWSCAEVSTSFVPLCPSLKLWIISGNGHLDTSQQISRKGADHWCFHLCWPESFCPDCPSDLCLAWGFMNKIVSMPVLPILHSDGADRSQSSGRQLNERVQ